MLIHLSAKYRLVTETRLRDGWPELSDLEIRATTGS